ncbi:TonB-dependent receptor plug domain-containing protein [Flavobacterium sp. CYK-4]|uniref:TonB-dependent receptor plug domain-containing protein n=1 Tax=Flavobacterium lotistagni TaxID=2709660 RepID=UPI00140943BA|nr:TonB-dependent receptor [Flavobacterium lotistagni]NHM07372.1 TonB-dependent receptor plug domain-containing protein [Flavobacterium lotistagni]
MRSVVLLILFFYATMGWSQKSHRSFFTFNNTPLSQVLAVIETKFEVKYSYIDSIVAPKTIALAEGNYTLEAVNNAIENQALLKITPINSRYFSVSLPDEPPVTGEPLKEILIEVLLSKGINKNDQQITLMPQKIEALPGVTDTDLLLSLQQLPGVKSPNETASGLYIRGGTSDQNLILWDGIRMYHPGHLFGMISGFNPNVPQIVNYQNQGTHPKFGERISSVIDIQPYGKADGQWKVDAGINALNADIYLKAPVIKSKLSLELSGRKSFTEWLQTATFDALADKVFQHTDFDDFDDQNKFRFTDYSARLLWKAAEKTEFSFTSIWIDNNLDFSTSIPNNQTQNQKMRIDNQGFAFHWKQQYGKRLKQETLLHYSGYTFEYKDRTDKTADTFELFQKLNRVTDSGMETRLKFKYNDQMNFELGYVLSGNDVSHSFVSQSQDLSITLDLKHFFNVTHSGYVFWQYQPQKWSFQAGTRYNYFSALKADSFEPRVFVQRTITNGLFWQTSYERKSQIMSQVRESVANDLSLENYLWVLADKENYPIQRAHQFTTGLIYKKNSWVFDLETYYKIAHGITSLTFGFLNQFDSQIHQGKGFTKGIDILIQKNAPNWRSWLTYTFQDSKNRFDAVNNGDYFPINADIRHALNLSFYKKWNHFSVTSGWFWHSGKPYSLLNQSNQVAAFNTERLSSYHRLDVSAIYQFRTQKSWSGKVGFSIYNLYNRRSLISREYERQYSSIGSVVNTSYKTQDYYSLGVMPNIFVRISL